MTADQSRPVPRAPAVEVVDRESLWATLGLIHTLWPVHDPDLWVDRILALVRPVEGVTLTPDAIGLDFGDWEDAS